MAGAQDGAAADRDGVGAILEEDATAKVLDELDGRARAVGVAVEFPAEVERGALVPVTIRVTRARTMQAVLELSDGRSIESHGWRVAGTGSGGGGELWQILFGVPTTGALGDAELRVAIRLRNGEDARLIRRSVTVTPRAFRAETIPLNGTMTSLRAEPDPRKVSQSQLLWELLNTTDLSAQFHRGRFRLPLSSYRYTSLFGDRRTFSYSDGNTAGSIHNGLDMAATTGTPIGAPGRGRVQMATNRIVTGGTVVIEHLPAVYSMYYHLDSISVEVGDVVESGDIIGTVGSTGLSTGPHLHWEVRVSGVAVDPMHLVETPRLDIDGLRASLSTVP
ncbi:MAG: M23 family metallopeptidase [Spirochaeta sp.]|nr:M23 family metallopeptidase [Spirochaeta sp.]